MKIDVTKNAKRNIIWGTVNKTIILLCPFLERTVIQHILGAQYLGLNSLYSSILSVLSLTELGFNTAMVFNMYKPMAEGNTEKINALLNFYKKIYRFIGIAVITLGLTVVPFLPRLISGTYPADISLTGLYLMYLANSSISYFLFAYMTSVLVVNQRDDIQSSVNSIIKLGLTFSQILFLIITKNYYLITLLMLIFTVVNNLWVAWRIHILFPQYRPEGYIDDRDKKCIKKLVTGTFIQRVCSVTRNSIDSICISAFLGLTHTAIYNNYFMISQGITSFVNVISTSFLGGVGNHVVIKSPEENFNELQKLNFIYLWISGFCTISLVCIYQPFMRLWMGDSMMLAFRSVVLLGIYFYMLKLGDMITLYASARGLWWEQRYRALGEAGTNIVLNIVLGKLYGIDGIITATIISLFICNYIWGTLIVFKEYFTMSRCKSYYFAQIKQTLVMLVTAVISYMLCSIIPEGSPFFNLLGRALICLVIPNLILVLIYRKTENFAYVLEKIKIVSHRKGL